MNVVILKRMRTRSSSSLDMDIFSTCFCLVAMGFRHDYFFQKKRIIPVMFTLLVTRWKSFDRLKKLWHCAVHFVYLLLFVAVSREILVHLERVIFLGCLWAKITVSLSTVSRLLLDTNYSSGLLNGKQMWRRRRYLLLARWWWWWWWHNVVHRFCTKEWRFWKPGKTFFKVIWHVWILHHIFTWCF